MIISASRRTDMPAWQFPQLKDKIEAMDPTEIDCIVFWTKCPSWRFKEWLPELEARGINYYFSFTLNNYEKEIEPKVPKLETRIQVFKNLADYVGPERMVWRYDPIIVDGGELTVDFHLDNLWMLMTQLQGYTHRLVFSFLDYYGKVQSNMYNKLPGRSFRDIHGGNNQEVAERICAYIAAAAPEYDMEPRSCSEANLLEKYGIKQNACIDGELIHRLFGVDVPEKDPKQRKECLCVKSIDIGDYRTCKYGCVYCYAS